MGKALPSTRLSFCFGVMQKSSTLHRPITNKVIHKIAAGFAWQVLLFCEQDRNESARVWSHCTRPCSADGFRVVKQSFAGGTHPSINVRLNRCGCPDPVKKVFFTEARLTSAAGVEEEIAPDPSRLGDRFRSARALLQ